MLSKKLHGVLRSKTFTLNHRNIHYRLNADKAQIRLIVDGFVMDIYNALLFQDATLEKVDTGGKMKWQSQSRDIYHYVGHRAHIEIIDHGDGFASVDEIRFSDGGTPIDPPSKLTVRSITEGDVTTRSQLAKAYGRLWQESIANWDKRQINKDQLQLIRWAVEHGLLEQAISLAMDDFESRQQEIEARLSAPMRVQALTDGSGEDEHVFIRGNHNNLGQVAHRRLLTALEDGNPTPIGPWQWTTAARRADVVGRQSVRVARHRKSPLASPVRHRHRTVGRRLRCDGENLPRIPRLLDWLARNLVDNDWSLKQMIRTIVLSSTYRMSSRSELPADVVARTDPTNRVAAAGHRFDG